MSEARLEVTPRMLEIPRAIAHKYAARAMAAGLRTGVDVEELESAANLAFAQALTKFDPAKGTRLDLFALQVVEWTVGRMAFPRQSRYTRRQRVLLDHDQLVVEGDLSALETAEEVQAAMALLTPLERGIVEDTADGVEQVQIGVKYGYTRQWVNYRLARIRKKCASLRDPDAPRPVRSAHSLGAQRAADDRRKDRRARGGVLNDGWYVVDDTSRQCWGDYPSPRQAAASIGIDIGNARHPFAAPLAGYPEASVSQLRIVRLLLERGALSDREMGEILGVRFDSARRYTLGVCRLGLARQADPKAFVFVATEEAASRKPSKYRLVVGTGVVPLQRDGYAVLPPTTEGVRR